MPNKSVFQEVTNTNSYKHRKLLINTIQKELGGDKLVVYTSNPRHPLGSIMQPDIIPFEDTLRTLGDSKKGVLMINSPGGNGDAAEKILCMCRKRFTESFRVIVPDYAKSAATMIALGADEILMGYLSELGPIDPQFVSGVGGSGTPARSLISGLEMIRENVKKGDPFQLYYPMMQNLKPETIAIAQSAIDGSREFAEEWLSKYQLKDDKEHATQVAKWLSNGVKYKSHGKVLNFETCKNELKLNVTQIPKESKLWANIWELYFRSVFFMQPDCAKLFENESISTGLNILIQSVPGPQGLASTPADIEKMMKDYQTQKASPEKPKE